MICMNSHTPAAHKLDFVTNNYKPSLLQSVFSGQLISWPLQFFSLTRTSTSCFSSLWCSASFLPSWNSVVNNYHYPFVHTFHSLALLYLPFSFSKSRTLVKFSILSCCCTPAEYRWEDGYQHAGLSLNSWSLQTSMLPAVTYTSLDDSRLAFWMTFTPYPLYSGLQHLLTHPYSWQVRALASYFSEIIKEIEREPPSVPTTTSTHLPAPAPTGPAFASGPARHPCALPSKANGCT